MSSGTTATDVAQMEADLLSYHGENETLRTQLEVTTAECDSLRHQLAEARMQAQEHLIRATQIETIMSQVSMGLVSGLAKLQENRTPPRVRRMAEQEKELGVGKDDPPPVAARREPLTPREPDRMPDHHPRDLDVPQRRTFGPGADQVPLRYASMQPTSSIVDSRLPRVDMRTAEEEESLRKLAAQIAGDE